MMSRPPSAAAAETPPTPYHGRSYSGLKKRKKTNLEQKTKLPTKTMTTSGWCT